MNRLPISSGANTRLIAAAAILAAIVIALLTLSVGVGADESVPAGPAAVPTEVTMVVATW